MLIGSHGYKNTLYLKLIQQYGFDTEVAQHLVTSYGDRAFAVATLSEMTGKQWPIHGNRLIPWYPYLEAEVKYAVRHEYAYTAVDVLARRTRLAFLNAQAAYQALPKVIEIMSSELNWTAERESKEMSDARRFLNTMGLSLNVPLRAFFTKDQMVVFRKIFDTLDSTSSGFISAKDVPMAFEKLSMALSKFQLQECFDSCGIKYGSNASNIDFGSFVQILEHYDQMRSKELHVNPIMKGPINPERSGGGI